MDPKEIKRFVDLIKNTDIEELHWESDGAKISIRRSDIESVSQPGQTGKEQQAVTDAAEKKHLSIKSPIVGTFYRAQSPDHPPLVMEGNHVVPGQKVAIVETMKIMRDVISTVKGKIVKIQVENGQSVEYGQELFLVDTENSDKCLKKSL
ncbi:MAG: biotin/lipoyl-containing protein [Elusimicrobiota bacterium]